MNLQKRYLTDMIGIILVLLILALVVTGTFTLLSKPARARGGMANQGSGGASRFADWLAGRGFVVYSIETARTWPTPDDALMFILAPRTSYSAEELLFLDWWVQDGGTLVIAQESRQPTNLPDYFGVSISRLWRPIRQSGLQLPVLNWPPVGQAAIDATHFVKDGCHRGVSHMGMCEGAFPGQGPLIVSFGRGKGQVFVMSSATPFTNAGLADAGNAQLVENLVLATAVPGERIVFDEAHHQMPLTWLFTTAAGWSVWLSLIALVGFFLWQNAYPPARQRAVVYPQVAEVEGGTAVSINSLTGAGRQFNRYELITNHYWQRLKRTLARHYDGDPALPDADFVESLKPHLNDADLGLILYLVNGKRPFPPMSHAELRQWVSVAVNLTDRQPLTSQLTWAMAHPHE